MQLLLKCRDSSGSVSFVAESIEGRPAPERHYSISDHTLVLDGPDFIVHHDATVLLAMADDFCRMPTPAEQDALVQAQQAASSVQESTTDVPADTDQKSEDDTVTDQPPALLEKIKKAVGG